MSIFFKLILYLSLGYSALWCTLFMHEFTHAFFGWLFGACKSPVSIGYLPWVKLPMTPLIDEVKLKSLSRLKQFLIHSGGLLMNLSMFIAVSLLMINNQSLSNPYVRMFLLTFMTSNFAELESYITFGTFKPISDVKFILEVTNLKNYWICISGIIILLTGMYFLITDVFRSNEFGYLIYFTTFYVVACSSRIILTRPESKI